MSSAFGTPSNLAHHFLLYLLFSQHLYLISLLRLPQQTISTTEPHPEPDIIPLYEDEPRIFWVGDCETLHDLLDDLHDVPKFKPRLFITLEGENLGRDTRISIVQSYNAVSHIVYLIDVYWLSAMTFWMVGRSKNYLKGILEDEGIIKVFFDVKKYSEALYSQYKIKLAGVHDLQLMELATRENPYRLGDLAECIARDASLPEYEVQHLRRTEWRAYRLFDPEMGGSYEIFNWRPLPGVLIEYCAQYVQIFPKLYVFYDAKLRAQPARRDNMVSASNTIVALSQKTICVTEE